MTKRLFSYIFILKIDNRIYEHHNCKVSTCSFDKIDVTNIEPEIWISNFILHEYLAESEGGHMVENTYLKKMAG